MALSAPTSLATAVNTGTSAAATTASFTPAANSLVIVVVSSFTASGTAAVTYSISDTLGGYSWTKVEATNGGVGNATTATIFYAVAPGSPTAGTVTVTPSSTGLASWGMLVQPFQITGNATSSPVAATGTAASATVTLSGVPASTSEVLVLGSAGQGSDPASTQPSGMTALFTDVHSGTYTYSTAGYKNGSASQGNTFGSLPNPASVAIEVVQPAAVPFSPGALPITLRIDATGTAFGAAPTWTDQTAALRTSGDGQPVTITWGRQDEQGEPQPRTCTFLLDNLTGAFTPGHASAASGWDVGARVNVRMTVGASTYDRFDGYVDSIEPTWPGGVQSWSVVKVSCTDVTARLAIGQPLRSLAEQEILEDGPSAFWPLTEPSNSVSAGDVSGRQVESLTPVASKYGAGTFELGADGPTSEFTSARFAHGTDLLSFSVLQADPVVAPQTPPYSLEFWFVVDNLINNGSSSPIYENIMLSSGNSDGELLTVGVGDVYNFQPGQVKVLFQTQSIGGYSAGAGSNGVRVDDQQWHHFAMTLAANGVTTKSYLDGALVRTSTASGTMQLTPTYLRIGGTLLPYTGRPMLPFDGRLSLVAFHNTELSAARVLAHYQSGAQLLVERSDQRYARIAGYANIGTTGLPTGQATMAGQNTSGKNVTEALADVARTEGTVSFTNGAGALTFQARNTRYTPSSTLSLTADDIDPDTTLRRDRQGFANEITVTRDGGATQRVVDTTSQTAKGRFDGGSFTVMPSTDFDALQNAAWQVAVRKTPKNRLPSVKVNLTEQTDNTFIGNVLSASISTLLTVTGLPSQAPASSVSLFIEGATESISVRDWTVEFFTSPSLPFTTLRADGSPSTRTKLDNGLKIPF